MPWWRIIQHSHPELPGGLADVAPALAQRLPYHLALSVIQFTWAQTRTSGGSTRLTLDVVPGRGAGFSLEASEGLRFLIRSDPLSPSLRAANTARPRRCHYPTVTERGTLVG